MKQKRLSNEEWLNERLALHSRLSPTAKALIENVLARNQIDTLSVTTRVKDYGSAKNKIERKKYKDLDNQFTDLTGIRIVVYFASQISQCIEVIRNLFDIDEDNSTDRSEVLGLDRMGYRSSHFVCTLGPSRSQLAEYDSIASLKFEIQVRTVLQHAWAELAHDRSYKFSTGLPDNIQREINLYSGLLEIADSAFDRISKDILQYRSKLKSEDRSILSRELINILSLQSLAERIYYTVKINIWDEIDNPSGLLEELDRFGLKYISDLELLISDDFKEAYNSCGLYENILGFYRSVLMYTDLHRFLHIKGSWNGVDSETVEFLSKKYNETEVLVAFEAAEITVLED
jgi:ppGpp synthetase/RelA/SpoT-type nucleotidyltranferase